MSEEARMSEELQESTQRTFAKEKELRPKNTTPKRQKSSKEQKGRIETIDRSSVNHYPSPRDAAVSVLLKLTQFEEDERKRKNFEDRGADT
ncbi:hypothetical protein PR002_g8383 [Phytophthora rubi]|uniref:Uncharacterized protein n=1 Tax=Phytophthora rubi TaxID=129364 RepID=A0A6A3N141_9STRA|nr:hypothetical protein PR002_g8383 [Phytophthora rubi]